MMNKRERIDFEAYRKYYEEVQGLIVELQQLRDKIVTDFPTNRPEYSLAILAKAVYTTVIAKLENISTKC